MAIFDFKEFVDMVKGKQKNKVISIALHSIMLTLCLIGSVIFLQDTFYTQEQIEPSEGIINTIQKTLWNWLAIAFTFIKIKIILPGLIILYFYYFISQRIFFNLFKDEYAQLYNQKYTKIHRIDYVDKKKTDKQLSIIAEDEKQGRQKSLYQNNNKDFSSKDKEPESSINMSIEMVKSMSRSMIESMKSIGGSYLNQSLSGKANLSMKSNKAVQNIIKKTHQQSSSQGNKTKNLSESFMSQSSSGFESDQAKLKIKAKKYYEPINSKNDQQFKKWYNQATLKYTQQIKSQSQQIKNYHFELSYFKKGLQKQLKTFLTEYKENYNALKQCLMRFWKLKIEGFQPKKPLTSGYQLSNSFKQSLSKIQGYEQQKQEYTGMTIKQKQLLKNCSTVKDFLTHLSHLRVPLRSFVQKDTAEKQLEEILSKMRFFNTLLNISSISGGIIGQLQTKRINLIQKCLNLMISNRIDIFSLLRVDMEFNDLDLFQEYDIEAIKFLVEMRTAVLIYLVNKINLMSGVKHFKVKMNQSVTHDSGFLLSTLQFFKNKNFAEVKCEKGPQNIFTHFNLKMKKKVQGQQEPKQIIIYCKPGLDNSISAAFLLVKEISQQLNNNLSLSQGLSYEQKRRQKSLREFIENFYVNRRF